MTELETYMLEMQALIMLMLRANRRETQSVPNLSQKPFDKLAQTAF
jgi:hypothetical protein